MMQKKCPVQLTGPGCWNGFFEQKVYLKGFVKSYNVLQEL